jgi:hypothetical protein
MTTITIGKYTVQTEQKEDGRFVAKAFYIKKNGWPNVLFNYRFKSQAEMDECINNFRSSLEKIAQYKEERRQKRHEGRRNHGIEPGQIYYTSWGWEQTNVDFFLIKEVKGQKITYVKLGQKAQHTGSMCGQTAPDVNIVLSEEKTAMATGEKSFKANLEDGQHRHLQNAYPYKGGTLYFSYYG